MSKYRSGHRECVKKFITIYKSEPSLWQIKSKIYHNRSQKAAAYARLVDVLKRIEPGVNRQGVVRKINSLRSNYRKELKKVRNSRQLGADNVYVPQLWYFKMLSFLNEQETADIIQSETADVVQSETEENEQCEELLEGSDSPNFIFVSTSTNSEDMKPPTEVGLQEKYLDQTVTTTRDNRDLKPVKRKTETFESATPCDAPPSTSDLRGPYYNREDRFDVFGKHTAMRLRDLPKQQRIIAEKLISEALFEAEMGTLTVSHQVTVGCKDEIM